MAKAHNEYRSDNIRFASKDLELGVSDKRHNGVREMNDPILNQPFCDSSDRLILFGKDLSIYSKAHQFVICAFGVFFFTIIYGVLQELITIQIAGRNYGIFLASVQFAGYSFWSLFLDSLRSYRLRQKSISNVSDFGFEIPFRICFGLSALKALELGLTYLSLQYLNYPAKTLIKSSRVVFTMMLGIVISKKRYETREYINVFFLVAGLAIFLNADSKDSPVFDVVGVIMLACALLCDGLLNNFSEVVMNKYKVGHDAFQMNLSSVGCVFLTLLALLRDDFFPALKFFCTPGTFDEIANGDDPTWSVHGKLIVLILFSSFGLFGASCAGAITKTHGAFYMSLTTTSRKALTLIVSFFAFPNTCTMQHIGGITIFMFALLMKSLRAKKVHEAKN